MSALLTTEERRRKRSDITIHPSCPLMDLPAFLILEKGKLHLVLRKANIDIDNENFRENTGQGYICKSKAQYLF